MNQTIQIRAARIEDLVSLAEIEQSAAKLFRDTQLMYNQGSCQCAAMFLSSPLRLNARFSQS